MLLFLFVLFEVGEHVLHTAAVNNGFLFVAAHVRTPCVGVLRFECFLLCLTVDENPQTCIVKSSYFNLIGTRDWLLSLCSGGVNSCVSGNSGGTKPSFLFSTLK